MGESIAAFRYIEPFEIFVLQMSQFLYPIILSLSLSPTSKRIMT